MAKGKVIEMGKKSNEAMKMQLDPFKLKTVECPNCEGIFFTEVNMFKEVVICNECGTVHPKFTPKELFENGEEK
jgi:uncharacterized Zn finger protein